MITEPLATGIRVIDGMLTLDEDSVLPLWLDWCQIHINGTFARESAADVNDRVCR